MGPKGKSKAVLNQAKQAREIGTETVSINKCQPMGSLFCDDNTEETGPETCRVCNVEFGSWVVVGNQT